MVKKVETIVAEWIFFILKELILTLAIQVYPAELQ